MKRLIAMLALACFVAAPAPALAQKQEHDPVYNYADDDAAINAAREDARRSYPQFLQDFRSAAPQDRAQNYMVKVGLDDVDGRLEHIWVGELRLDGDRLVGVLANEPRGLSGMRRGSPVEVEAHRVSDWSILRADGLYGNFTTRVMLDVIPPEEAAQLRAVLSVDPLPPGWPR